MRQGKYIFDTYVQTVMNRRDVDVKLIFSGDVPQFEIFSLKAHEEVMDLYPSKVDRADVFKFFLSKICVGGLDQMPTNDEYKLIRNEFTKALGINAISKRIPELMQVAESFTERWREGEEIDMIEEIQSITFEVINYLCFGSDASEVMDSCRYINSEGSILNQEFGK
eukprot:CAMPEP_0168349162 /NCGR_PEP_ID=MMETSP0213-20121227/20231_1 /TAXON_ID=151035 /ORGANISM="Euplotes harpa, Strain FSP1.4" /LENGTH=166 /DNA_ID=CAMNT_0008359009 /DNA_START=281 /DNA_END=781 /DNA_ORIENTATION=+